MPFIFSFRHMESSPALEAYTEERLRHTAARYGATPLRTEVIFDAENQQRMICTISISDQGRQFHADDSGNYMYDCVDRAIDKIDTMMRKAHSKAKPSHETLRAAPEELIHDPVAT
jgi:ribosomal subunit interface protein